jgi:hypothetical protein
VVLIRSSIRKLKTARDQVLALGISTLERVHVFASRWSIICYIRTIKQTIPPLPLS